ncbi:MAG: hypothetical protein AAF717_05250 [Bacteroidota bacterium]
MNCTNLDGSTNDLYNQFNAGINSSKSSYLNRIKEIFAIEKEKLRLRDSKEVIERIFKKEMLYNIEREKLLFLSLEELQEKTLGINPLVNIYESDWKWFDNDPFRGMFDLKEILNTEKSDHYFLLEKTGTSDALLDSNVFESPLTEYQYFLLQLFEEPKKVKDVITEFIKVFEVSSVKEKEELLVLTENQIRELIFKRFILIPDIIPI